MEMFSILDHKSINFTETQDKILMGMFQANKFLTKEERCKLAMSFNTTEEKITNWYKYMRHKEGVKERLSQG